jgi:thiol-disulfide isomerase/thioredoxin
VIAIGAIVAVALANRVPKAAQTVNAKAAISVGQTAPDFAVSTNAGPFQLSGVSTPVLLELFATWCPHCQRMVPVLDQLHKEFGGKIAFVAVSASPYGIDGSSPENQADVMNFVEKLNVSYPVAFDPDLKVGTLYLQGGYPTLVIIGADKKIRWIRDGEIPAAEIHKALTSVLSPSS